MSNLKKILAAGAIAAALMEPAFAAAYIKFDGVDGEAKSASFGRGSGGMQSLDLTTGEDPVAVGLLLPAVQSAREAARRTGAGRPKSFSSFSFDDGRKTWTLHDATATPNGPNAVKILFRCKDWLDQATGAEGSDCGGAGKGKVEASWKIEKGE
ncbi:MAG: hypothetical protein R3C58_04905 [Parvularculaceae bacterium]